MYFWFFEARKNASSAPLSMWLSGGPGVPSTNAALAENGPCKVLEDSKTTELNAWSWNEKSNLLYIDQPLQVGYSYDYLVNGTIDEVKTPFQYKPANFLAGVPETNLTFLTGTFASQQPYNAPNTSVVAASFIYDFMQPWMQEYALELFSTNSNTDLTTGSPNTNLLPTASASGASLMVATTVPTLPRTSCSKTILSPRARPTILLFHFTSTPSDLSTRVSTSIPK
jgi:hypothetical protein